MAEFDQVKKISGIDNLWIRVTRSQAWHERVKPLLNIGGLVKYPMGKGGLVLNQLLAKPSEAVPVNAQKKQTIVATLLRNLHATFTGGRILTAANLKFQPLPLEEQCNQYLTKDRGWFGGGGQDLSHLPIGNQDFGGVPYVIRDFRTSPLPSCVMLAGPGARGHLPKAVQGLKGRLQGGRSSSSCTPSTALASGGAAAPRIPRPCSSSTWCIMPTAKSAEVPVLYGEGADHWMTKDPAGLKSAALAWAAPFPAQKSEEQAVVYQFTWNNPRPEAWRSPRSTWSTASREAVTALRRCWRSPRPPKPNETLNLPRKWVREWDCPETIPFGPASRPGCWFRIQGHNKAAPISVPRSSPHLLRGMSSSDTDFSVIHGGFSACVTSHEFLAFFPR